MLQQCTEYLEEKSKISKKFKYEIIVVSDGNKDKTVQKSLEYSLKYTTDKFRVLELVKNRGKGGAVRLVKIKKIQCIPKNYSNYLGHAK
jgi:dolichyl-phosphate beta-glucosyltransferase